MHIAIFAALGTLVSQITNGKDTILFILPAFINFSHLQEPCKSFLFLFFYFCLLKSVQCQLLSKKGQKKRFNILLN